MSRCRAAAASGGSRYPLLGRFLAACDVCSNDAACTHTNLTQTLWSGFVVCNSVSTPRGLPSRSFDVHGQLTAECSAEWQASWGEGFILEQPRPKQRCKHRGTFRDNLGTGRALVPSGSKMFRELGFSRYVLHYARLDSISQGGSCISSLPTTFTHRKGDRLAAPSLIHSVECEGLGIPMSHKRAAALAPTWRRSVAVHPVSG